MVVSNASGTNSSVYQAENEAISHRTGADNNHLEPRQVMTRVCHTRTLASPKAQVRSHVEMQERLNTLTPLYC